MPRNAEIIQEYRRVNTAKELDRTAALQVMRKRGIRTLSGVAPVAVLTEPHPCPGRCAYCPSEKGVPQSYLSNEPAVMRAIRCRYDPYTQVSDRLKALVNNGHAPDKIELIVIGGTWSVLPNNYKHWFIKECFRAANLFQNPKTSEAQKSDTNQGMKMNKELLLAEQNKNERARHRIIGVTLETRPDYINHKELLEMRELGCTRVELGVQAIDDSLLKKSLRGHGVREIVEATRLLKYFGFKVTYHFMSGLPGSSPTKDLAMYCRLFNDERFQPDQIKFYPTVVTKGSQLYAWWKKGLYRPYSDKVLEKLIIDCKRCTPEYVRIVRLIRDIPEESIVAGNKITNLRQIIQKSGARCRCIRCREAKEKALNSMNQRLKIIKYSASKGTEFFISCISKDNKILYGFCRLRLNKEGGDDSSSQPVPKMLRTVAIIRELHVYGELAQIGRTGKVQHSGLGKRLMAEAERIARSEGFFRIAVIAGIGVRGYYRKLGYRLAGTYLAKRLYIQQSR